jgi:dipeptidyl aminopeptidase/acylaminoacyl peptidase
MTSLRSISVPAVAVLALFGASAATAAGSVPTTTHVRDVLLARVNAAQPDAAFATYNPDTARLRALRGVVLNATELAVSPKGTVAYTRQVTTGYGGSTLYVTSSISRAGVAIAASDVAGMSPDWSPDGQRVAFVQTNAPSTVSHLVVATLSPKWRVVRKRVFSAPGSYTQLRWSPDGRALAVIETSTDSSRLVVVDSASGNRKTLLTAAPPEPAKPAPISRPSWYDRNVVIGTADGIYKIATSGREPKRLLSPERSSINPLVAAGAIALGLKTGEGVYDLAILRGRAKTTVAGFVPVQWLDRLPTGTARE